MNTIGKFIKEERKKLGLTQEEFAMRAGLGLRFVRELEQGKDSQSAKLPDSFEGRSDY